MAPHETTPHGWTILDADAGVLSYSYTYSAEGQANCFTAKLPSGGIVIISPPTRISAEAIADLAAYGPIEAIVANNGFHHLGIASWREKFPNARCFAAEGAITRIGKRSNTAGALEPLAALKPLLGDDIAVVEAPTSRCGETWARVKVAGGYAWYASDILANMPELPSNFLVRAIFKLSNSAPGYRVFGLAVKFIIKDKKAAFARLLEDLRAHPPTVMVPAHGQILAGDSLAGETTQLLEAAI